MTGPGLAASTATLVKAPQSRRGKGLSLVHHASGGRWGFPDRNVYVKTQTRYNCRPARRLWRSTPTFDCEQHALSACACLTLNAPRVLSYRSVDGVTELVLEDIAGALALPFFWAQFTPARVARVLTELGRMVGELHRAGWTHGAIAGAHVLVQPHQDDKVWLIDFEKARQTVSAKRLEKDLSRFFRRSPYLNGRDIDCFFNGYRSVRAIEQHAFEDWADRFKAQQNRSRMAQRNGTA